MKEARFKRIAHPIKEISRRNVVVLCNNGIPIVKPYARFFEGFFKFFDALVLFVSVFKGGNGHCFVKDGFARAFHLGFGQFLHLCRCQRIVCKGLIMHKCIIVRFVGGISQLVQFVIGKACRISVFSIGFVCRNKGIPRFPKQLEIVSFFFRKSIFGKFFFRYRLSLAHRREGFCGKRIFHLCNGRIRRNTFCYVFCGLFFNGFDFVVNGGNSIFVKVINCSSVGIRKSRRIIEHIPVIGKRKSVEVSCNLIQRSQPTACALQSRLCLACRLVCFALNGTVVFFKAAFLGLQFLFSRRKFRIKFLFLFLQVLLTKFLKLFKRKITAFFGGNACSRLLFSKAIKFCNVKTHKINLSASRSIFFYLVP